MGCPLEPGVWSFSGSWISCLPAPSLGTDTAARILSRSLIRDEQFLEFRHGFEGSETRIVFHGGSDIGGRGIRLQSSCVQRQRLLQGSDGGLLLALHRL